MQPVPLPDDDPLLAAAGRYLDGRASPDDVAALDAALAAEPAARRRGIARDSRKGRTPEEAEQFWDEWMSAEMPFLDCEQPWRRAHLVVDGTADCGQAAAMIHIRAS